MEAIPKGTFGGSFTTKSGAMETTKSLNLAVSPAS